MVASVPRSLQLCTYSCNCSADALPNVLLACKVLVGWMALVSLKILLSIILVHFAVCYKDMVEAQLLPRSRDLRAL
ncbi:MAG: hypothetical protein KVP17_004939 [Porospora cf. gigantea B]|uniref:uncharacterized protein n=1 Tax=Porospora cf. gigantea B TaxID=2853592 RepID=UPI0035718972|nr:MAG: hypothetical protein KVP17_004939 [Porospora cf. gigantea B]